MLQKTSEKTSEKGRDSGLIGLPSRCGHSRTQCVQPPSADPEKPASEFHQSIHLTIQPPIYPASVGRPALILPGSRPRFPPGLAPAMRARLETATPTLHHWPRFVNSRARLSQRQPPPGRSPIHASINPSIQQTIHPLTHP